MGAQWGAALAGGTASGSLRLHAPKTAGKSWGQAKEQMRLQTHLTIPFGGTKRPFAVHYLLSVWCSREPQSLLWF